MVKAEQYKEIVRRVLAAMGYEPIYGNFRLWDPLLDWRATAKLMDQPPTRTALCHILDGNGKVVRDQGRPVVVARDIEASTEAEAAEILSRSSHVFVKWWPSNSPNRPGAGADGKQCEIHDNAGNNQGNPKDYGSRVIEATRDFLAGQGAETISIARESRNCCQAG